MKERSHEKSFMPVCIDLSKGTVVIIGGGRVALHKIKTIRMYTRTIAVIAPEISVEIEEAGYAVKRKLFEPADLDGALLVYACTNSREVNLKVAQAAAEKNILCNVCDDPGNSVFVSPAVFKKDNMSIAVSSNGLDVKRSVAWRNRIKEVFEHDLS
jgi:precorrin-2 dehydrogenase / sirohydrochlorin ferrochelatase